MELKFVKCHIDSRFKESGTHSSFQYTLAEPFNTPEGCVVYVDNVSIPHSWYSVDVWNNSLYIAEFGSSYSVRKVTIPSNSYTATTLKIGISDALNANRPSGIGAYTVVHTPSTNKIAISSDPNVGSTFHILTDDEIKFYDQALLQINKGDPQSFNGVLRNREGFQGSRAQDYTYSSLYTSGSIDILAHHNVYIHSSLSSFNTLGPNGASDIICKVPVNANYGVVLNHNSSGSQDYQAIGKRTLSTIFFSLRDAYGHEIDLQGASWSLSLVFAIKE